MSQRQAYVSQCLSVKLAKVIMTNHLEEKNRMTMQHKRTSLPTSLLMNPEWITTFCLRKLYTKLIETEKQSCGDRLKCQQMLTLLKCESTRWATWKRCWVILMYTGHHTHEYVKWSTGMWSLMIWQTVGLRSSMLKESVSQPYWWRGTGLMQSVECDWIRNG